MAVTSLGSRVGDMPMPPMVMTFSTALGFDLLVSGWTISTNADLMFAFILVLLAGFARHWLAWFRRAVVVANTARIKGGDDALLATGDEDEATHGHGEAPQSCLTLACLRGNDSVLLRVTDVLLFGAGEETRRGNTAGGTSSLGKEHAPHAATWCCCLKLFSGAACSPRTALFCCCCRQVLDVWIFGLKLVNILLGTLLPAPPFQTPQAPCWPFSTCWLS